MLNADITLDNVFVPDENKLIADSFHSVAKKILAKARIHVAFLGVGMAVGALEECLRYISKR